MSRRPIVTVLLLVAVLAVLATGCGAAPDPTPAPGPSAAEVEATRQALDERAGRAPETVTSWGVDPASGLVLVSVVGERDGAVDAFLAGLDPRTLQVEEGALPLRPMPGG